MQSFFDSVVTLIIKTSTDLPPDVRLEQHGAVYLNAIGGAAQFYARCIDRVEGVPSWNLELPRRCGIYNLGTFRPL